MGRYGYISIIAMVCYAFMLLMFLAAKRNKIVNSFLVVLTGLLLWTGGSAFMRAQLWPQYEFWYQVSLFGILLLPYAYYRFILAFGGVREGMVGKIYLAVILICLVANIWNGFFLACPELVKKNGTPTFVYDIKPTILVLFFLVGAFLLHLFVILVHICKANPNMKAQYDPVMFGVVVLFAGNVLISLPLLSGFPIDVLSGVVNVFLLFYALTRRRLFQLQMLASSSLCYGVGFLFSVIVFFNVVPYLQKVLHLQMDTNMTIYALVFAVAFLIIYALFTFLWKLLVRNVFVKEEIHQAEKIKEFSSAISKTLDLQKILNETIHVLKELMDVGNIYICMQDAPGQPYRGFASDQPLNDLAFSLEEENPMIQWLSVHEEPLIYREFRYTVEYKSMWESEKHQLDKKRIRYCAGLKDGDCLAGVLLITSPSSKKGLVYDEAQLIASVTSVASIAIKNARMYEKACIEARTDEMTGLLNRKYFYEVLNEEFEKNKDSSLALAIINVDDFKLYNDMRGHHAGDMALITVVEVIRQYIRKTDKLIRYGGDEFLLLLPEIDSENFARKLNKIKKKIAETSVPGYERIKLSVSIGGVSATEETVEEAVQRADKRMYLAKMYKNTAMVEGMDQKIAEEDHDEHTDILKPRILIVDDSKINRELLTEILRDKYQIIEAENGNECVEKLEKYGNDIALILLDIVMPKMDGFAVLEYMNQEQWIDDIPVIVISGEDSEEYIWRAYEAGAVDYIRRPFDMRIVYQRVFNMIKLYAKQRRLVKILTAQIEERENLSQISDKS